jgi:hypothetical protein
MRASFTLEQLSQLLGVEVTGVSLPVGSGWNGAKVIFDTNGPLPAAAKLVGARGSWPCPCGVLNNNRKREKCRKCGASRTGEVSK